METRAAARDVLDKARDELVAVSHWVHAHPELKWEEELSSAYLAEHLADAGLSVTKPYCDLPTAFLARAGSGPLHVALCCEYDALPGIGHACGHNIIAAAAVGAGRALAAVADDAGLTVSVVGTPAEEGGGGKIRLLDAGGFDGVHLAAMVHPGPYDTADWPMIAAQQFQVRFTGKAAHASAFPELGINALDAMTVAQVGIGLLRQHLRPSEKVHGVITRGGDAPNVVPALAEGEWMVRGVDLYEFERMKAKVLRCFEAGALATGSTLTVTPRHQPYTEVRHDPDLVALYRRAAADLGRDLPDVSVAPASTDMGNVSLRIPSIHPGIGIDSLPAVNHQPEFTAACVTEAADRAVYDGAVALAWVAIDAAADPALRDRLLTAQR